MQYIKSNVDQGIASQKYVTITFVDLCYATEIHFRQNLIMYFHHNRYLLHEGEGKKKTIKNKYYMQTIENPSPVDSLQNTLFNRITNC